MKKHVLIILWAVFLFVCPPARAEVADHYFSYGVFISDSHGGFLPTPQVPLSFIEEGLTVRINNCLERADRFQLLCVLNGQTLSFSVDGGAMSTSFSQDIGANEEKTLTLRIRPEHIAANTGNVLHVVLIGALDKLPKDERDYFSNFSHTVSLPLNTDAWTGEQETLSFDPPSATIGPRDLGINLCDVHPRGGLIPALRRTNAENTALVLTVHSRDNVCVLLLKNNEPLPFSGRPCLYVQGQADADAQYEWPIPLGKGNNAVYTLMLPLEQGVPAIFSISDKLLMIREK